MSKENCVLPHLQRMERRNQHGVYCIFTSLEMGSTFSSKMPRFPTDDPDYRIIRRIRSRYLHYYFYVRDPVIGPLSICIGTYLPFQTTYYLNDHNFIEIELRRQGVAFRKDDNAFLSTSDPKALQAAADSLERAHQPNAPQLLDRAAGSEVLPKRPQGPPSEAGVLDQSDRILPELRLQTEFSHPQDF